MTLSARQWRLPRWKGVPILHEYRLTLREEGCSVNQADSRAKECSSCWRIAGQRLKAFELTRSGARGGLGEPSECT